MRTLPVCFALLLAFHVDAQLLTRLELDSVRTYRSLEAALKDPDKVYRLDLSGRRLKEVPAEVRALKNLNHLNLDDNRLRTLPDWFGELAYLQELRLHHNRFVHFPEPVCGLANLTHLDLSRNRLEGLIPCLGGLDHLVSLDLWSNDIAEFPDELSGLRALKFLDLRVIQFDREEMQRIGDLLPWAEIQFSEPCNCGM